MDSKSPPPLNIDRSLWSLSAHTGAAGLRGKDNHVLRSVRHRDPGGGSGVGGGAHCSSVVSQTGWGGQQVHTHRSAISALIESTYQTRAPKPGWPPEWRVSPVRVHERREQRRRRCAYLQVASSSAGVKKKKKQRAERASGRAIIRAMPGVTKYNLVDDAHDLRIPMHNDEVFKHGVCFEAKVRSLRNRYFLGRAGIM